MVMVMFTVDGNGLCFFFMFACCRLPATSYGFGYRLPVTGYSLSVTGYWLPVTGYQLLFTGYRLMVAG